MTIADLHSITNFADLQNDPRFVGLMIYLKRLQPELHGTEPHSMIKDSGRADEYLRITRELERVFLPPAKGAKQQDTYIPYSDETWIANKPTHA